MDITGLSIVLNGSTYSLADVVRVTALNGSGSSVADARFEIDLGYDFMKVYNANSGLNMTDGGFKITATKIQKPRVKKQKPPAELIKKMVYLKEAEGFTSEHPVKIVGAKEVYLFNVHYRKLTQIVAMEGYSLSVKGTTIINFDPEKSFSKTIRKPEILKDIKTIGLRSTRTLFKDVRAVNRPANGRVNDKTIILAAY